MQELILLRGIPASGKSTFANTWIKVKPGRAKVSRDDIRFSLYGTYFGEPIDENAVTAVEDAQIKALLKAGHSVVVDDTNIEPKFVKRLAAIGHDAGVSVQVFQFDVDSTTAKQRNAARERKVPDNVIDKMYDRLKQNMLVDVEPFHMEPYVPDVNKPAAIIVDIDGTIAERQGDNMRSPYDWMRVGEDALVHNVHDAITLYYEDGYDIIVMSGRDEVCREVTEKWLSDNGIYYHALFMRPRNDSRKDSIVKYELFDNHVRNNYNVHVVFDDRQQVVDMWRKIGLTCFQVAPGEF